MRVFVTGATGFIGSAIVPDLLRAGHQVLGLARSDEGAKALLDLGADVHRGDLEDLESLRSGAASADGVIHAGFNHDFSKFAENSETDRRAIEAMGEVLAGSARPLIVTAGLHPTTGRATTEDDELPAGPGLTPRVSEQTALALVERSVHASVMRIPQVHDRDKQGLVTYLIQVAREKGVSAYVGEGLNRWAAVHRLDTASAYRLALEKGVAGARYHVVAEEGVTARAIAEVIGRGWDIPIVSITPEEAAAHFGWLAFAASMDAPASSQLTQERLGWQPTQETGLIADLERASAFGK
ncbi:MAG: SDR family oxidoreductase [Caulobacteraceae bacterium]|nr:MAG: SDR family oxidoreductase [Caulobacteraceae bacterium]